ncbi:hypothetical protein AQUCO_02400030v1 [Aquilegia coerulea]|uniref:DYW domain-containing protein n=1 Tax=Aquilegia coerulea TaxID=218851 RepID=A0A2G5DAY2_AQUCA|nr:hypothetical protein AQUCO_02400030v1 [Aquilegia coerulea]
MIRAYANNHHTTQTLELYLLMRRNGVGANNYTYPFILKACASRALALASEGKFVHADVIKTGFHSDVFVQAALVDMYAKCGETDYARCVFDAMPMRDLVSWTAMITAYEQSERAEDALMLFIKMQENGDFVADSVAIVSVASAVAQLGDGRKARAVHAHAIRNEFLKDLFTVNAIVAMYAKCGNLEEARLVFDRMEKRDGISWNSMLSGLPSERNVSSWNVMISAYGMHGHGKEALQLFTQMQEQGFEPNHITYTSLLSACSHSGLTEEGRKCFKDMKNHSVTPTVKHYACMVDMLGRAGLLDEAFNLINRMPSEPNDGVWGALLLACRIHGNTELGEVAAKNLFHLEPEHTGYYVLMSNIYAASRKWQEVGRLRQDMKSRQLRKPAALSVIEFGKEVHGFHTGDKIHPQCRQVHVKVEALFIEMKMAGYIPDRACVLHDVEDEEKDQILKSHSEKLAVAFGIMNVEPGLPIQVTMNLRICNDCHLAFKFISSIYQRKIIVRDANRFHHFEGGLCSCKDYW